MTTVRSMIILMLTALMTLGFASPSHGAEYYVDAAGGNDAAAGTRSAPWQTVARVNRAALTAGSTVYFKAGGSYLSKLLVPQSGSPDRPVTYTSYGTGAKPELTGFNATGKSWTRASNLSFSSGAVIINLSGADHVTVDDCTLYSTATKWTPPITIQKNARYNRITNCTITQEAGNCDTINLRGNADYNLIQGNTITVGGIHAAIDLEGHTGGGGTAHYNIIRNNVITGTRGAGALITLQANSSYNVIEGNTLTGDDTTARYCGTNRHARHQCMMKVVSMHNIVRNNIIKGYPCKDSLGLTLEAYRAGGFSNLASGNHVYNNVITGILVGGTPLFLGENGTGGKTFDNIFKNNIIYNNGGVHYQTHLDGRWPSETRNVQMRVQASPNVYNNSFRNNLFYKAGVSGVLWLRDAYYSVAQAEAMNPKLFSGNLQTDPVLDQATLRPGADSPVRGAGAALTVITSPSGYGSTLTVADAYYFSAGLGLVPGDTIQINRERVAIKEIDYPSHTLTLARPITWKQGDAVNLPFSGAAPDLGLL